MSLSLPRQTQALGEGGKTFANIHWYRFFRELVSELGDRMEEASEMLAYEQAANYRDQITRLKSIQLQFAGAQRDGVARVGECDGAGATRIDKSAASACVLAGRDTTAAGIAGAVAVGAVDGAITVIVDAVIAAVFSARAPGAGGGQGITSGDAVVAIDNHVVGGAGGHVEHDLLGNLVGISRRRDAAVGIAGTGAGGQQEVEVNAEVGQVQG